MKIDVRVGESAGEMVGKTEAALKGTAIGFGLDGKGRVEVVIMDAGSNGLASVSVSYDNCIALLNHAIATLTAAHEAAFPQAETRPKPSEIEASPEGNGVLIARRGDTYVLATMKEDDTMAHVKMDMNGLAMLAQSILGVMTDADADFMPEPTGSSH